MPRDMPCPALLRIRWGKRQSISSCRFVSFQAHISQFPKDVKHFFHIAERIFQSERVSNEGGFQPHSFRLLVRRIEFMPAHCLTTPTEYKGLILRSVLVVTGFPSGWIPSLGLNPRGRGQDEPSHFNSFRVCSEVRRMNVRTNGKKRHCSRFARRKHFLKEPANIHVSARNDDSHILICYIQLI